MPVAPVGGKTRKEEGGRRGLEVESELLAKICTVQSCAWRVKEFVEEGTNREEKQEEYEEARRNAWVGGIL